MILQRPCAALTHHPPGHGNASALDGGRVAGNQRMPFGQWLAAIDLDDLGLQPQ